MGTTSEGTRTDAIRGAIYMKRIVYSDRSVWVTPAEFDAHERGQPWRWTDVPAEPTRVGRHEPLATLITRLDQLSLVRALRLGPFPPLAAAEPGARRV
jgi:predicted ATP-grasp superfamily ATP-dependent carboligase